MEPGFDTMNMPYLASPLSLGHMQSADYINSMPSLDLPDQRSNFDGETFIRCACDPLFSIAALSWVNGIEKLNFCFFLCLV